MDWSNSSMSENSDVSDSEIEFELYSQLHYNTAYPTKPVKDNFKRQIAPGKTSKSDISERNTAHRLTSLKQSTSENNNCLSRSPSLVSLYSSEDEDWQIITSSSDSEEPDNHPKQKVCDIWKVSSVDHERMNQRIFRYYNKPTSRCNRCNRPGHSAFECYQPRKTQRCCMCGNKGHHPQSCKGSLFLGPCYKENKHCERCDQTGHGKKHCPDKWRQFHLTVAPGPLTISEFSDKTVVKKACYHCFKFGHFPYECENRWEHENHHFLSPMVSVYDKNLKIKKGSSLNSASASKIKRAVKKLGLNDDKKCEKKLKSKKNSQTVKVQQKSMKKLSNRKSKDISTSSENVVKDQWLCSKQERKGRAASKVPKLEENTCTFDNLEAKLQWLNGKRKRRSFGASVKRLKLEEEYPQNLKPKTAVALRSSRRTPSSSFHFNFSPEKLATTGAEFLKYDSETSSWKIEAHNQVGKVQKPSKKIFKKFKKQAQSSGDSNTNLKVVSDDKERSGSDEITVESENMFCNSQIERRKLARSKKKKTVAFNKSEEFLDDDYIATAFPRTNADAKNQDTVPHQSPLSTCLSVTIENQTLTSEILSPVNQCQELTLPCA